MSISKQEFHHSITIFVSLVLLFLSFRQAKGAKSGLSLKIIHRDFSPESPFYNPNQTYNELRSRHLRSDKSRLQYINSLISLGRNKTLDINANYSGDPMMIRPRVYDLDYDYMVHVSIGTGAGRRNYKLHLDTGSGLTWTQCEPCPGCPDQIYQRFNPSQSSTFKLAPCNDPLCSPDPTFQCLHPNDICAFHYVYGDNTYSMGFLSYDSFAFETDHDGIEQQVTNVPFGCVHSTTAAYEYYGGPAGIFGMSLDPESFASQTINIINGRFSYCFAEPRLRAYGTLRFGSDIPGPNRPGVQRTPILRFSSWPNMYYLRLNDLSIGANKMRLFSGLFTRRLDGTGGVIIDSGCTVSKITSRAFKVVIDDLRDHFKNHRLVELNCGVLYGIDTALCYCLPQHWEGIIPDMTWHFSGADFHMDARKVFHIDYALNIFYFKLVDGGDITILGVEQQVNHRFMYDVMNNYLYFNWEDCSIAP